MIYSLILGRKGSVGFPGKNLLKLGGKPLSWYAMNAAIKTMEIDRHFISTDDNELMILGESMGFEVIIRPDYLATSQALGDDAYLHGYREIIRRCNGEEPELLVLLFCNAPTINSKLIGAGIKLLRDNPNADSAVTVSRYNMYSPSRARSISTKGFLQPFIPFEHHSNASNINCDRDSQGDVWFADVAVSVIRPKNLEALESGMLPQRWMGQNILPIKNEAGFDLDYEWQLGQASWWLEKYGDAV
jgi:CMP-N-acetylneuraminic acid synthetase